MGDTAFVPTDNQGPDRVAPPGTLTSMAAGQGQPAQPQGGIAGFMSSLMDRARHPRPGDSPADISHEMMKAINDGHFGQYADGAINSLANGLMMGFGPEARGAVQSLFGADRQQVTDDARRQLGAFQAENPASSMAGNLGGGAMALPFGGAAVGAAKGLAVGTPAFGALSGLSKGLQVAAENPLAAAGVAGGINAGSSYLHNPDASWMDHAKAAMGGAAAQLALHGAIKGYGAAPSLGDVGSLAASRFRALRNKLSTQTEAPSGSVRQEPILPGQPTAAEGPGQTTGMPALPPSEPLRGEQVPPLQEMLPGTSTSVRPPSSEIPPFTPRPGQDQVDGKLWWERGGAPPKPPVVRTPRTPDDVAQVQMKAIVNHLADVVKGGGSLDAVSAKMLSAQFPEVSATFRSKALAAAKNVAQSAPHGSDVSEFIRSFAKGTIASVAGAATIQAMVGAGGQLHDTGTGQFVSPDDPQVRIKRMRNATSNVMRSR